MTDILNRIIDYKNSETVLKLNKFYRKKSIMEIYDITRKEIRHTSFLYWLFHPDTEIAEFSIRRLLDILISSKFFDKETISEELINQVVIGSFDIESWQVTKEYAVPNGRVDLLIELKIQNNRIRIILENKIDSNENNNQTQKYYDFFSKDNNVVNLFVYLTPKSSIELEELQEPECCCKKYIEINYQIIVDKIIEPLLRITKEDSITYILEDYLKALSFPINNKTSKFMAISKYESELLLNFWEENKDLILKAVQATNENMHLAPDVRENAGKIMSLLNDKDEKVGAYVQRNIRELARDNKITAKEEEEFQTKERSKEIFDIQYPLLVLKSNSSNKPAHYWVKPVIINNNEYYLCCEWFENSNNNDRACFDKWLQTKQ